MSSQFLLSGYFSGLGNNRGAKKISNNITATINTLQINVGHPGHFNAAANETNTKRNTNKWSFLGSRSKPLPPEVKVYAGLLAFCLPTILVASLIDNQRLAFLCLGLILGPPLVLALADVVYPLEEVTE